MQLLINDHVTEGALELLNPLFLIREIRYLNNKLINTYPEIFPLHSIWNFKVDTIWMNQREMYAMQNRIFLLL